MNIRKILNYFFGGGTKAHTNIRGVHEAMGQEKALALAKSGKKVSRMKEKPNGWFVEWDDIDKVFREGIKGSKTRKLYVPEDNPADYVSADWYIVE